MKISNLEIQQIANLALTKRQFSELKIKTTDESLEGADVIFYPTGSTEVRHVSKMINLSAHLTVTSGSPGTLYVTKHEITRRLQIPKLEGSTVYCIELVVSTSALPPNSTLTGFVEVLHPPRRKPKLPQARIHKPSILQKIRRAWTTK